MIKELAAKAKRTGQKTAAAAVAAGIAGAVLLISKNAGRRGTTLRTGFGLQDLERQRAELAAERAASAGNGARGDE